MGERVANRYHRAEKLLFFKDKCKLSDKRDREYCQSAGRIRGAADQSHNFEAEKSETSIVRVVFHNSKENYSYLFIRTLITDRSKSIQPKIFSATSKVSTL